jgi:uncharacterized protein (DUF1015 family)
MAELAPFRGWRYNRKKVPDLRAVVAPPYDVIEPAQQRLLHERHLCNVVHADLGEDLPEDNHHENRYSRAAGFLHLWQREGILLRDGRPSLYLYHHRFLGPDGRSLVRRGFIGLLRLEPLNEGSVFPHEETFPKHKVDRLHLMRACRAHFNPVFSLFPDPEGETSELLAEPQAAADASVVDEGGVVHQLWVIEDEERVGSMVRAMRSRPVFIADGHHRYETCLKYRDEQEAMAGRADPGDPAQWTLMYFTPMEDHGLIIYPTHKLVRGICGFEPADFLGRLGQEFILTEFPLGSARDDPAARGRFLRELAQEGERGPAMGLAVGREDRWWVLTPRDPKGLAERLSHVPECVRGLDVTILHETIFRGLLGIDIADPTGSHLSYLHDAAEGLDRLRENEVQMAFIMNPTRIQDLRAVASARCKMPQKATYFYPKLLSGLVFNIMEPEERIMVTK